MKPMKSAFFTGHRNVTNIESQVNQLIQRAKQQGIEHFYCGMALGTDSIAARMLTAQNIPWTAVIPFIGQEADGQNHRRKNTQNSYFILTIKLFSMQNIPLVPITNATKL